MFVHVFSLCKWIAIRLWSIQTLAAVQSGTPVFTGHRLVVESEAIARKPIRHSFCFQRKGTRALMPELGGTMLYYALVFLVVALIAGVLGVSGVAAVATNIAYVLFVIAIVLFL